MSPLTVSAFRPLGGGLGWWPEGPHRTFLLFSHLLSFSDPPGVPGLVTSPGACWTRPGRQVDTHCACATVDCPCQWMGFCVGTQCPSTLPLSSQAHYPRPAPGAPLLLPQDSGGGPERLDCLCCVTAR